MLERSRQSITCQKRLVQAFLLGFVVVSFAQNPNAGFSDNIDRTAPSFIKASLLVMGPGKELYSCAGHACFRLECPTFKHDYCFSYEGESASDQIFKFFAGKLKMGMFAVPTQEFLKQYDIVLDKAEVEVLRSKISTLEQNTGKGCHSKHGYKVLTERGLYMLATILLNDVLVHDAEKQRGIA